MLPEQSGKAVDQRFPVLVNGVDSLAEVDETAWNGLNPSGCPFLSHAFLAQLEARGLVGPGSGWLPRHALATRNGKLFAAIPLYEKSHSFGEFVFDWVWADAYQRAGLQYFPKLVAALPFTPVPGKRLLARTDADMEIALPALLEHIQGSLQAQDYSSAHVLFPCATDAALFAQHGFQSRLDCRFLWRNDGFTDFEDFLRIFNARQRKNIRRERRKIRDAGIAFEWREGDQLNAEEWARVHAICASTFLRRGQLPYIDAGFFEALARRMPGNLLVNIARQDDQIVAAAIFFRDQKILYGRYWGSRTSIDCLHFESCYYQGIEYAIDCKLELFDPGTQGEHKLRRGFAPVESWSMHRFADERMGRAIGAWLSHEQDLVHDYIRRCREDMPFSDTYTATTGPA